MSELKSASEFGTARGNLSANANNALKLKTTTTATVYQKDYSKAVASGKKLVSVVVAGETITFADTILVQNVRDVEDALFALLQPLEVDVFIKAKYSAGTLEIKYISSARNLGAITLETAGAMSTAENSTIENHSRVKFSMEGSPEIKYDGGAAMTLANDPYAFTGDVSTDETTADTLVADLITAFDGASMNYADVTVSVNKETEMFDVTYRTLSDDALKLTVEGSVPTIVRQWDTYDSVDATFYAFE